MSRSGHSLQFALSLILGASASASACSVQVDSGESGDETGASGTAGVTSGEATSATSEASAGVTTNATDTDTGDGDGDGDTSTSAGDGDGDTSTSTGDGDGDTGTSAGDGDGDASTGDGDGDGNCSALGVELVNAINAERAAMSLAAIPLSPSLCHVAQVHSQDLVDNEPDASADCNLHSWSAQGSWSACCYTADHAASQCMWDKPGELTNYPDNGFEISAGGYPTVDAAVQGWMSSAGHRDVILNANTWSNSTWRGVGGGYVDGHWNVWFGEADDPGWP